jgi:hypothetical protein
MKIKLADYFTLGTGVPDLPELLLLGTIQLEETPHFKISL